MAKTDKFEYGEKIVAFIDVLGFAALVKESATDASAREQVANFVDANRLFERFFGGVFDLVEGTFFSDSFVLSTEPDRMIYLIREAGYLCRHLLMLGFPCRGGIAAGLLYHRTGSVVGPALVQAYELECTIAQNPRVVVHPTAMELWRKEFVGGTAHDEMQLLIKCDAGGQDYIDIFSPVWTDFYRWTEFVSYKNEVPDKPAEFLAAANGKLAAAIDRHSGDNRTRGKYEWLMAECNEAAAKLSPPRA